jgi:hypothetical protein
MALSMRSEEGLEIAATKELRFLRRHYDFQSL